jgi:hypothetical protein
MASSNELLVLGLSATISDDDFLDERRSIALGFLGSLEASDPDCDEEFKSPSRPDLLSEY